MRSSIRNLQNYQSSKTIKRIQQVCREIQFFKRKSDRKEIGLSQVQSSQLAHVLQEVGKKIQSFVDELLQPLEAQHEFPAKQSIDNMFQSVKRVDSYPNDYRIGQSLF